MPSANPEDPLKPLGAIMQRHGVRCTPSQFQAAVNVTFHEFESEVYDREHADMWLSLPREFDRLARDCAAEIAQHGRLNLLDIGCGTGLATDCLLKSPLGNRIENIDLLDTSRGMLRQATKRAQRWNRPFRIYEGLVDVLPKRERYSLIVSSSVLHHVPDLRAFLHTVRSLQGDGGIYIHLQDPNGDYANDAEFKQRVAQVARRRYLLDVKQRFSRRVASRICRGLVRTQDGGYCAKTNRELLNAGIIATPLSVAEIYSITDIHVQDGTGVSLRQMKEWMPTYALVSTRSYAFFGMLWSNLPSSLKREENRLSDNRALNGAHVGAAWKLR